MNASAFALSRIIGRDCGTSGRKRPSAPVLLNECPEVIGKMAVDISGGGSIEHAIRGI